MSVAGEYETVSLTKFDLVDFRGSWDDPRPSKHVWVPHSLEKF